jgi:hypothetical protein
MTRFISRKFHHQLRAPNLICEARARLKKERVPILLAKADQKITKSPIWSLSKIREEVDALAIVIYEDFFSYTEIKKTFNFQILIRSFLLVLMDWML